MSPSTSKLSKALLDLSRVSDVVLRVTAGGQAALVSSETSAGERTLLERIDGFRSVEQLLAISGDVIGVHAALGKLVALGFVVPEGEPATMQPETPQRKPALEPGKPIAAPKSVRPATAATQTPRERPLQPVVQKNGANNVVPAWQSRAAPVAKAATTVAPKAMSSDELARAKALLGSEAAYVFGSDIARFQRRIDACRSIEEIYDLIVKVQDHLSKTGKADPMVFLDRLTAGLASARATASGRAATR